MCSKLRLTLASGATALGSVLQKNSTNPRCTLVFLDLIRVYPRKSAANTPSYAQLPTVQDSPPHAPPGQY
jgi:hypothetical protein